MKPIIPPPNTHTDTQVNMLPAYSLHCVWNNTGTHKMILWQTNMKNLLDNTGLTDEGNPQ